MLLHEFLELAVTTLQKSLSVALVVFPMSWNGDNRQEVRLGFSAWNPTEFFHPNFYNERNQFRTATPWLRRPNQCRRHQRRWG